MNTFFFFRHDDDDDDVDDVDDVDVMDKVGLVVCLYNQESLAGRMV